LTTSSRFQRLLALSLAMAATGCTASPAQSIRTEANLAPIEVTVTWRERMRLPPDAQLIVTVADVARAGAPATVLAETVVDAVPPPPIRVELPIDGLALDPRARYSARARVLVGGELRMISDTMHPVLRTPGDRAVEVVLRAVPSAAAHPTSPPDTPLANTYWRLTRLDGEMQATGEGRREASLILREVDGRRSWSGTVGCNRLTGAYESSDGSIRFSAAVSTRMACPPPLDARERGLLEALERVSAWRISGERLALLDGAGAVLIEAEAVHLD
jgi:putative lipoprotein